MVNALLGQKAYQSQGFLENGTRIPVTHILVADNSVTLLKTQDKDGYTALQVGIGEKKDRFGKTIHSFLKEIRLNLPDETLKKGDAFKASDVFKEGDIVDVISVSKGKGYAGVVKRHHFKGGPRTHGQSDRERAPGSIGQTTTPGRVYKGKRMAGRMGASRTTVKNLRIMAIQSNSLVLKGLVPGARNSLIMIKKVGEDKKFVPMHKEELKVQSEELKVE